MRESEYRQHSRLGVKGQLTETMPKFIQGNAILPNQRVNILYTLHSIHYLAARFLQKHVHTINGILKISNQKRYNDTYVACVCFLCPLRNGAS